MIKNPEIQRKLWTDFTLHRVLGMPAVLGLFFFAVYYSSKTADIASRTLAVTSATVFTVMTILVGAFTAARSITNEVNERTWDYQRLSAQSPWQLLWGKLFGSTLYVWYGGAMAYAVFLCTSQDLLPSGDRLAVSLLLPLAALISHLIGLLAGIDAIVYESDLNRKKVHPAAVTVIAYMALLNLIVPMIVSMNNSIVKWYGLDLSFANFALFSSIAFLIWLLFACHEKLRRQFRMKTGPWLTMCSPLFLALYIHGIEILGHNTPKMPDGFALIAFGLYLMTLYYKAFAEPWTGTTYRRLIESYKEKRYGDILYSLPLWVLLVPCAVVSLMALLVESPEAMGPVIACSGLFFALRDIMILHFFKLSPNIKWPIRSTFFYLVLLYGLLPFLAQALSLPQTVSDVLTPNISAVSAPSGLIQFLFAAALVLVKWHRNWTNLKATPENA